MIVCACLSENMGMMFNHRRQSRDKEVIKKILSLDGTLYMNPYSAKLFPEKTDHICDDFMDLAGPSDYCFVETLPLKKWEDKIEGLILFFWNRDYPADLFFDLNLDDYEKIKEEEFPGSSHEKITMITFIRKEEEK